MQTENSTDKPSQNPTPSPHNRENAFKNLSKHLSGVSSIKLDDTKELEELSSQSATGLEIDSISTEKEIPIPESRKLNKTFSPELEVLKEHLETGDTATIVDGYSQKMFIVEKTMFGFKFHQSFTISTAEKGFGNKPHSQKTPTGLHQVRKNKMPKGELGSIIKGSRATKTLVKDVKNANNKNKDKLTTAAIFIEGPDTPSSRGIALHGTNSENDLGKPKSHGCIRLSNKDILKIHEITEKQVEKGKMHIFITDRTT